VKKNEIDNKEFEFTFIAKAIGIGLVLLVATILCKGLMNVLWWLVEEGVL